MTAISIEAVPVVSGVLIGLLTWRLVPVRLRLPAALALSGLAGSLITYASGELRLSWAFLVFDVGQVVVASLVTGALAQASRRRPARVR